MLTVLSHPWACRWTTCVIMDMAYGHYIHFLDNHQVGLAQDIASVTVRAGSPGSIHGDFFLVRGPYF